MIEKLLRILDLLELLPKTGYGTITITIKEGKIVGYDKTEKFIVKK